MAHFGSLFADDRRPVIGMVHLPALPGAPGYRGDLVELQARVVADAEALADGGVDGLMLENFGDVPFFPARVPASTVAHMTALAAEVRQRSTLPLGINVLRNDGVAALSVAHAVGASWIRVNVLDGARLCDQGIVSGIAHELLRERSRLGATEVGILADVEVKHSVPLGDWSLEEQVQNLVERAGADALVVSGAGTGQETAPEQLERVKRVCGATPVLVGSGIESSTVHRYPLADGFIVGTSLKRDGDVAQPVDPARVEELVRAVRAVRSRALD